MTPEGDRAMLVPFSLLLLPGDDVTGGSAMRPLPLPPTGPAHQRPEQKAHLTVDWSHSRCEPERPFPLYKSILVGIGTVTDSGRGQSPAPRTAAATRKNEALKSGTLGGSRDLPSSPLPWAAGANLLLVARSPVRE